MVPAGTPRRAGCPVICVTYGYREGAALDAIDADALVDSLVEAAALLTPFVPGMAPGRDGRSAAPSARRDAR
jgi:hypothetical protein